MVSYSNIIKRSYLLSIQNPVLWLFGLFVLGGFNLNLLNFQNIPARQLIELRSIQQWLIFFQAHPTILAGLSFSLLIFSLLGSFLTNWSRIMLALVVQSLLKTKFPQLDEQVKKSQRPLSPVIMISLLTALLMVIVASGLFLPQLLFADNPQLQMLLWAFGAVVFLPLAFVVSCINIFTTFFVVIYGQGLGKALTLGTDFFVSRWTEILGLVGVLVLIYCVCFFVGVSLLLALRATWNGVFTVFPILGLSAIMVIPKAISALLLWLLLAILSVFINTSLLLLFFELTTPVEVEKASAQEVTAVSAAPIAGH